MCKYCHRDENGMLVSLPHDKYDEYGESILIVYDDGIVDLWVVENGGIILTEDFKFNYCPMCGRELSSI